MPDDGALLAAPAPAYNRWPVLATCMLVEAFSGMMYAFGLYSAALKKNFDLSQGELSPPTRRASGPTASATATACASASRSARCCPRCC